MRYRSRGSRECYRLFTMICRSGLISIFLWLALLLLGYPKTACASHFVLLETGYRYEDNFSRTVSAGDQKDDWVFTTRLKIGKPVQLRAGLTSSVAVNFSKDFFNTYNRLENHSVGISISVNRKLGLGFYVPRLRFYTAWSDY
ncbi:MAG: hypothetical protein QGH40_01545, partial [bacterium]|nr:hypothetical protein [bacterium]